MNSQTDTLEALAGILVESAIPLRRAVTDLPSFRTFLHRLGWRVESLPSAYVELGARIDGALGALESLRNGTADVENVLAEAKGLYEALRTISEIPAGVDEAPFLSEVGAALFDLLIVDYLASHTPSLFNVLRSLGAIGGEYHKATTNRPAFRVYRLRLEELRRLLTEPVLVMEQVFGWRTTRFDFDVVAEYLLGLFAGLRIPVALSPVPEELSFGFQEEVAGPPARPISQQLIIRFLEVEFGGQRATVGMSILDLPQEGSALPGILLQPLLPADLPTEFRVGDHLIFRLRPGSDLGGIFGVAVTPEGISVRYPFDSERELPGNGFGASVEYRRDGEMTLVGRRGGTRLILKGTTTSIALDRFPGGTDFRIGMSLDGFSLVLPSGEGDSFFRQMVGEAESTIPIELRVEWSSRKGFGISGGTGFEISRAPIMRIGPLTIQELRFAIRTTLTSGHAPDLIIDATASIGGRIGPIGFSIANMGLRLTAVFEDGNVGPFDISIGFKPPDGMGLVIDAGPITGGGFLKYDEPAGRYFGDLELEVYNFAVKAFGILDTQLPGGDPAYSFVIIVSTEFSPVPIGFGFTLNGVGGVAGIHRRLAVDVFRERLGQGTLDHILFPANPIQDAPQIVSDLQAVLPPAADRYVFGPMARIAWGTPALLEGKLGILLELPEPVRLVLLGQFRIVLPRKDSALITLNLDVIGELEPARQRLALDGRLHHSDVIGFPLEGDLAVRINGGSQPSFALSIGGFNPAFTPPAGFPKLQRITIGLGLDENPRITLEGYLALTSNTLQVGALATLYAEAGWFNVTGHVGFDALFIFSPFSFITDFSGGVALNKGSTKIAGITLDATISGPTPWRVAGEACLEIWLLPDICVPVHFKVGDDVRVELPTVDPWPLLREAAENPESWSGERPAGVFRAATTAPSLGTSGRGLVDPAAGMTLRQTVVPLNRQITRFGASQPPGGSVRFDIQAVSVAGNEWLPVQDFFAPAQFEDLSEDEKLSRPGFERMDAGLTVARTAVALGRPVGAVVEYETRIIDSAFATRHGDFYLPGHDVLLAAAAMSSAAASPLRNSGPAKFAQPPAQPPMVSLKEERFVIVSTTDLSERRDIVAPGGKSAVHHALAAHLSLHPEDRGRLEVMSTDELFAAA